jgi:hypothetical protein
MGLKLQKIDYLTIKAFYRYCEIKNRKPQIDLEKTIGWNGIVNALQSLIC